MNIMVLSGKHSQGARGSPRDIHEISVDHCGNNTMITVRLSSLKWYLH